VLFYTTTFRSYIEAIPAAIDGLSAPANSREPQGKRPSTEAVAQLKLELQSRAASLEEAEVTYLFCTQPLVESVPLFGVLDRWLAATLSYYGVEEFEASEVARHCSEEARNRFRTFLASDGPEAEWLRRYLDIAREETTAKRLLEDLASIRHTLNGWVHASSEFRQRERQAWEAYRQDLRALPDQKETMYNEVFGVRKVFLEPQATYHVAGVTADAGDPKTVPDLGRLLGVLLSSRVSGEDLIILCGGPGCGKSTLCRMLVSQLADNPEIHPVFLRLRRLREGSDIALFIEESLHRLGVINRLSDLRGVSNLVLVLDGFDELVMASRSRLRQFFNMLGDEHAAGPLRNAKILVSGRDTLFPAGEGLPTGSHVISLLPFDPPRVSAWGRKWRELHESGQGRTFRPELLLNGAAKTRRTAPLQHLVSWPLTLHLVARVHTAGRLNLGVRSSQDVEKAYLYRSILAETATRQTDQTEGKGRLESDKMRRFVRSLAWMMYYHSKDSMDPSDVMPLLAQFYPDATEADMSELADVAVVNCPELAKGEETGFEFVHKSFAEYLVAERVAHSIEHVIFKAPQFGTDELTWRMTDDEAAAELAPVIGIRLVTEEVQEMLEPMLGCLAPFLKGDRVDQVVSGETRRDGLKRVVEKFQILFRELLQGRSLDTINRQTKSRLLITSPLEAYANQCAGYLIIGTAAARQLATIQGDGGGDAPHFSAVPYRGAFWQCLCLLHAGGLTIDRKLARRLTDGLSVEAADGGKGLDDTTIPIRPGLLAGVKGYDPILTRALAQHVEAVSLLQFRANVFVLLLAYLTGEVSHSRPLRLDLPSPGDIWGPDLLLEEPFGSILQVMRGAGLIEESVLNIRRPEADRWRQIQHYLARARDHREALDVIGSILHDMTRNPMSRHEQYTGRLIAELLPSSLLPQHGPTGGFLTRFRERLGL